MLKYHATCTLVNYYVVYSASCQSYTVNPEYVSIL